MFNAARLGFAIRSQAHQRAVRDWLLTHSANVRFHEKLCHFFGLARASWRTWPHRKLRRNIPRVDGALTVPPRVRAVPPVRNTSAASMQSPPASADALDRSSPLSSSNHPTNSNGRGRREPRRTPGPLPALSAIAKVCQCKASSSFVNHADYILEDPRAAQPVCSDRDGDARSKAFPCG